MRFRLRETLQTEAGREMAKVLVTGGAGFIGSYVCRELLSGGHEVVALDAFVHYVSPLHSRYQKFLQCRFAGIADQVEIVRGDTRNKDEIRRTILQHRPSKIIHLAALPIADLSNVSSEEALTSIIGGTVNILEIIRDVDFVERFVYASSSMIYGDFQYCPADEDHPKVPKDVYGGTKYAGEVLTQAFGRRFGIEYTIVRPSAVYGATDVNRRVSQLFVENAVHGEPLILHGDGSTELDFTHVKDTAHGFVLATFGERAANETFNITCGKGRSLREFADILRSHFPDLTVEMREGDIFRPKRGGLDIAKARELLGYEPRYQLEAGIKDYLAFMQEIEG